MEVPGDDIIRFPDVQKASSNDSVLGKVIEWARTGWPDACLFKMFLPYFQHQSELSVHKGCLSWGPRIVIPECFRKRVLQRFHAAHMAMVLTKGLARCYTWWPGMDGDIEALICACDACPQTCHAPPQVTMVCWLKVSCPWSRLYIDHVAPFQNSIFFLVVDTYSKWLKVIRVLLTGVEAVIRALRSLFVTHRLPDCIVSDNHVAFTCEAFQNFMVSNMIEHILTPPGHPSSNGQVERMVQTTKEALVRVHGPMDTRLVAFLLSQHVMPNAATGYSPAELLMNKKLRTGFDRLRPEFFKYLSKPSATGTETRSHKNDSLPPQRHRMFAPLNPVYAKGFGTHPKWTKAAIMEVHGTSTYNVRKTDWFGSGMSASFGSDRYIPSGRTIDQTQRMSYNIRIRHCLTLLMPKIPHMRIRGYDRHNR